jgi:RimJ/RimL family protein N-acetyltransferase
VAVDHLTHEQVANAFARRRVVATASSEAPCIRRRPATVPESFRPSGQVYILRAITPSSSSSLICVRGVTIAERTKPLAEQNSKMFDDVPLGDIIDAQPAKVPQHLTITGQYVALEPIAASHAPALYQQLCLNSPERTWAYVPAGPFESEESFAEHVDKLVVSRDPLFFTVITKSGLPAIAPGSPVGYLSLMRIDVKNRGVEIGHITLSAALQRTTAATEALFLAMRHCFEGLGNRRLEWKCDSLNAKSRRAAQRLGFVPEGVFRKHLIVRGRSRDTAWFSIVDDEWPARKAALERWLDGENFDAEGRQKKTLDEIRKDLEEQS